MGKVMTFKGRVDRIGFIGGCILSNLIPLVLTFILAGLVVTIAPENEIANTTGTIMMVILHVLGIVYWFMNLTHRVRDTGLNPYWTLLITVPIVNLVFFILMVFIRTDAFKKKD